MSMTNVKRFGVYNAQKEYYMEGREYKCNNY